jgi:hypothetical protein
MDGFLHILQAPAQSLQGSPERVGQELVHPNVEPLKDDPVVRGDSAKNQYWHRYADGDLYSTRRAPMEGACHASNSGFV